MAAGGGMQREIVRSIIFAGQEARGVADVPLQDEVRPPAAITVKFLSPKSPGDSVIFDGRVYERLEETTRTRPKSTDRRVVSNETICPKR